MDEDCNIYNIMAKQGIIDLQLAEIEILNELAAICAKHQLKYYLTAGTLLGAVRHQGFVPWDDDIDVVMPRCDFDKLKKICRQELSKDYFYQDRCTDKNYPFYFAKLRKNNTEVCEENLLNVQMHKGIYIDIFPLDKCPKGKVLGKLFFKVIELFYCAIMARVNNSFVCGYKKKYMRFLFSILRCLPKKILDILRELVRILFGTFSASGCLCTVGGSHGYPRETYQLEWFAESVVLEFEGRQYPAPVGWHELLTNMYGDYMQPPDELEKTGHFVSWERGK